MALIRKVIPPECYDKDKMYSDLDLAVYDLDLSNDQLF